MLHSPEDQELISVYVENPAIASAIPKQAVAPESSLVRIFERGFGLPQVNVCLCSQKLCGPVRRSVVHDHEAVNTKFSVVREERFNNPPFILDNNDQGQLVG